MDYSEGFTAKISSLEKNTNYKQEFTLYKLTINGFRKLEWSEAHKVRIKDLCLDSYVIKIGEIGYLCGNDEVWKKQEGKPREWTHTFVEKLFEKCVEYGLSWRDVLEFTFHHSIITAWTHRLLVGEFVNKGDSWRSNQNQTYTPF